ncbi:MAG: sigma-70 family RNA polymerase sigma factor [Deltaproteobacteria bacterium]|nr:sigma-70 family RNA polymerase sigma factor [Deltaproteobacteria bacterium]
MNRTASSTTSIGSPRVASSSSARGSRGASRRGRAVRAEHDPRVRARRSAHERRGAADVDQLYLSEMAQSSVLTPEQEVIVAKTIVEAERAVIAALVSAPAGARALAVVHDELVLGSRDLKSVLLNPDQANLDLPKTAELVIGALEAVRSGDPELREAVVDTLAGVRLGGELVEGTLRAIQEAAPSSPLDAEAAQAVERARRALRRGKERLVVGNLRLVVLFARKYLGRGVPLLDLVQEGNLGLMRAADKFDHTRGFRFSTYASWWIKQALQRALLDRTLRLPVHVADDRRRVGRVRASFLTKHRREPSVEELSSLSGLPPERVQNILDLPAQPASLDTPIGEDGDATLGDLVPGSTPLPETAVVLRALEGQIESLVDALTPREQQVLKMRFGMGGSREHTLEEVGKAMQLTRERIRQIEKAALEKLRVRGSSVELRSYLDG